MEANYVNVVQCFSSGIRKLTELMQIPPESYGKLSFA